MSTTKQDINSLTSCIALMEQHRKIHILSVCLTLTTTLLLLYLMNINILAQFWLIAMVGVIILGLLEMVYAVRIGFDLFLLRQLANHEGTIESGLTIIDNSLTKLHLMPAKKVGRSLNARLRGCVRLFRIQVLLCALQLVVVVGATVFYLLLG